MDCPSSPPPKKEEKERGLNVFFCFIKSPKWKTENYALNIVCLKFYSMQLTFGPSLKRVKVCYFALNQLTHFYFAHSKYSKHSGKPTQLFFLCNLAYLKSDKTFATYAFLDPGSSATFCKNLISRMKVKDRKQVLKYKSRVHQVFAGSSEHYGEPCSIILREDHLSTEKLDTVNWLRSRNRRMLNRAQAQTQILSCLFFFRVWN